MSIAANGLDKGLTEHFPASVMHFDPVGSLSTFGIVYIYGISFIITRNVRVKVIVQNSLKTEGNLLWNFWCTTVKMYKGKSLRYINILKPKLLN